MSESWKRWGLVVAIVLVLACIGAVLAYRRRDPRKEALTQALRQIDNAVRKCPHCSKDRELEDAILLAFVALDEGEEEGD